MAVDGPMLKQTLSVSLDADLIRRASALAPDLSETLEHALASFVGREEARRGLDAEQIRLWIEHTNATIAKYGSPDEWTEY